MFDEGDAASLNPLVRGGKGNGLAVMASLRLPIPPGFTFSTSVARAYAEHGRWPKRVHAQLRRSMSLLEKKTGKKFGDPKNPLLVSVRSGAPASMPGMMDSILNVGLNGGMLESMYHRTNDVFPHDCLNRLVESFRSIGRGTLPQDPWQQLEIAIQAVIDSWNSERAIAYRKAMNIPDWWQTAVNVQSMVFGNLNQDSATGVVFSRNVATGAKELYGEFLINAQGEDVVSGTRTPLPIFEMESWNPRLYAELAEHCQTLESHYNDVVDVEFTIEDGKLYLLQSRVAKRTPEAAATIAVQKVWEKSWTREHAIKKVDEKQIEQLYATRFLPDEARKHSVAARGIPASPGAVSGLVAETTEAALLLAKGGQKIILVRPDTSPADLPGMLVSSAIITLNGGATSHAAVVARSLGIPAVVGCSNISLAYSGELVSVDGSAGIAYLGEVPTEQGNAKKEVNIFRKWYYLANRKPPRIGFEHVENTVSADLLLNDFYLSDAMLRESAGSKIQAETHSLQKKIHENTAEIMSCYLMLAVASEAIYPCMSHHYAVLGPTARKAADLLMSKYKIRSDSSGRTDRWERQSETFAVMKNIGLAGQIEFFEAAEQAFAVMPDNNGVGGPKWAAFAAAAKNFLNGKLNHTAFVDHAFDLRHNGGRLFGKHD
ncbi:MAG TPA: pyruvate, phosphate dikinase, partial [Candidatus Binatia bacterium]|nr:pyruvate, phosphate dikinase [Candidatus Binatia bacterium]